MGGNKTRAEEDPSAESLVRQIADGDRQAEQKLVSKLWRGLQFILLRRTGDPELASDLAQDTFIIVINKARQGEIEKPAAITSFIRQTAINLLIGHYRKETRQATDLNQDMDFQVPDHRPDIYQLLHSEQAVALVLQIIEEMNVPRDREILKSHYFYEQDKSTICKALDLSPGHFDRVLYRARSRLKQMLIIRFDDEINFAGIDKTPNSIVLLLAYGLAFTAYPDQGYSAGDDGVRDSRYWSHLMKQDRVNGPSISSGEAVSLFSRDQLRDE